MNPSSCFPKLLLTSLPRGGAGITSGAGLLPSRSHLAKACFASLRCAQRPMLALPQTLPRRRGKQRALAGAILGVALAKGCFAVLLPRSLGGRDAAAEPTGMCLLASPGKQVERDQPTARSAAASPQPKKSVSLMIR